MLRAKDSVTDVKVYDRTQDAVVLYDAERGSILRALAQFSFAKAEAMELVPEHTSRALNREFEDKLAVAVMRRIFRQTVHAAAERYANFLRTRAGQRILFLELGVGYNTPTTIIKYPFWCMTAQNANAAYACVNFGQAMCPNEISQQAICVDGDIGAVLTALRGGEYCGHFAAEDKE